MKKCFFASLVLFLLFLGCGGDTDNLPELFCGGKMYNPEEQHCEESMIFLGPAQLPSSSYSNSSSSIRSSSSFYSSSSSRYSSSSGQSSSSRYSGSSGQSSSSRYSSSSEQYVSYYGENYEIVAIGSQFWFKRNLNYNAAGSKCYDDDDDNCIEYGRLYNWETAKDVCPPGWRLPTNADWDELMRSVDPLSESGTYEDGDTASVIAGRYLKALNGWNNGNGEDIHGFSALPGGDGNSEGDFSGAGYYGYWWSATESNYYLACNLSLYYNAESVNWYQNYKASLFSVRCMRN
jgi:uncharacterized protein (TIGR02145 family)